ncbi:MAG: DNA mismatch repair protein MutS [Pseudomonadota bacterium]
MMQQYLSLKEAASGSLLFYRMGDFFELFFDDAREASKILDIALTTRGEHDGEPVPMCGVPVHSAEGYLARLIKAGCRVAIAEQTETPDEAKARAKREGRPASKALVARDIVRFVTAGTLTEEALLEPSRANIILALANIRGAIGVASCDISTGVMTLEECTPDAINAEIARLGPSEVVVPDGWNFGPAEYVEHDALEFVSERGLKSLCQIHEVTTLDGFGEFSRAMLAAAGGLIAYLEHVGRGSLPLLLPPVHRVTKASMVMDEATRGSLEILESASGPGVKGKASTLIGAIDRCSTGAGSRQLAQDLSAPLLDRQAIEDRLALVQFWLERPIERANLREQLRKLPDLARSLGRVVAERGSPRDLGQIRDGLIGAESIYAALGQETDRTALLDQLIPLISGHGALIDWLARALIASPPTERSGGGYIADGYDASLDELREVSGNARKAIAAMETRYREETDISSLKIKHNGVLGYFIEVPARHADALMDPESGFTHRQTMKGAVRFNSLTLHEEAARIAESGGRALAAEEAHFEKLSSAVSTARNAIAMTAQAMARIDVAAGLAERASEGDWCRPSIFDDSRLNITSGRHPVVEAALAKTGDRFVANDCSLKANDRLWLIGGPNMGGKSTFLRQNALIVLLAQAGCFVPAASAEIGLVDRLFSRVGASDNLARGRSTFMVEMVETAAILSQATERSFVILDEVGRGTSTYDGLALAWAVVESVHSHIECRCLFATHYHELSRLAEQCKALSLHHVRAREWKGDLVLLHELSEGPADRSYGLAVAKLAGVPPDVIKRAKQVLDKLEDGKAQTGGIAVGLGELPLFAASAQDQIAETSSESLENRLSETNLDALSPRDALDLLYRWKQDFLDTKH